jgi:hypothetical protein
VLKVSGADGKEMAAMADSGSAKASAQAPESVLRDLILVCGLFASCQYGAELGDVATRNKVFREERSRRSALPSDREKCLDCDAVVAA